MLQLHNISKIYGEKLIIKNVNLQISAGSLLLMLGANGAGKSTLLRIMANLTVPTAGWRKLAPNKRLAYIGHATFLYPHLSALDNLHFQLHINKLSISHTDLMAMLEKLQLDHFAHEPTRHFSRGMAQRLNLARALLLNPDILLLDEPFTGLDQHSTNLLKQELSAYRAKGAAIVLISHNANSDVQLATHVCRIAKGKMEFCLPVADFQAQVI